MKVEWEIHEQLGERNTLRLEAQGHGGAERLARSEHEAVPRGQVAILRQPYALKKVEHRSGMIL